MPAADGRPRVLFLCTGNACRSQMAEGWARAFHDAAIDACSAGTAPAGLSRRAVRVMAEAGIDISGHRSKSIGAFDPTTIDLVITVCDHAHEHCPVLPGASHLVHRGFDDPPRLAAESPDAPDDLVHFRRVRDEIRDFVAGLPALLCELGIPSTDHGAVRMPAPPEHRP